MVPGIYEKQIAIRSEFVTMQRILRTSSLFRFLQEASIAHTEELGMGRDKTLDRGLLWILSHQRMTIDRMPAYDEEITLKSWPGKMMHVFFPRFYEVWQGDTRIMHGEALWLLMEEATRTMAFPSEHGIFISALPGTPDSTAAGAVRVPKEAVFSFESIYRGRFSQTDINGHINNANYFDMIDDLLPDALTRHSWPKDIRAEYLTEIRPGEEILIRGYQSDDSVWYTEGIPMHENAQEGTPSPSARPLFRILLRY